MESKKSKKRLTAKTKADIIQQYKKGSTVVQLAKDFSVSRPTVYKILNKANLSTRKKTHLS